MVAVSVDGGVRLYGPDLKLVGRRRGLAGRPCVVRFSPDDRSIAVGYENDQTTLTVLSSTDLTTGYSLEGPRSVRGSSCAAAWSTNGKMIYAAGDIKDGAGHSQVLGWSAQPRSAARSFGFSRAPITDVRAWSDGRIVVASTNPAWKVFDSEGAVVRAQEPVTLDWCCQPGLLVSADARKVRLPLGPSGGDSIQFSLDELHLTKGESSAGLSGPKEKGFANHHWEITDWDDGQKPHLGKDLIKLDPGETSRSYAIAPDGSWFGWALTRNCGA